MRQLRLKQSFYKAGTGSRFGWGVAAARNATTEVVVVGAIWDSAGGPAGDPAKGFAMPHDTPVGTRAAESFEGSVYAFIHPIGGAAGEWKAWLRLKSPVPVSNEQFGVTVTAGVMDDGTFMVGVGTYRGCKGYVVSRLG